MNDHDSQSFESWLRATHGPAHSRRTAERNAVFFLPHLKPGMALLDAGCGPGSITIGLARAISPGEAVGIDASAESIAEARTHAMAAGVANVRFEVADVCALPFDNATFDAVFAHALLQHVSFPLDALEELRRVLKPGGVIGVADADFDGAIVAPESDALARGAAIMRRMRRNPHVGKHLRELLHEAGFVRIQASATCGYQGDEVSVRLHGEWNARYFEAEPLVANAVASGWAQREELREIAAAWRLWSVDPRAFAASFWCEAVGWAPQESPKQSRTTHAS
jgi:ubiquinone/menaquinone biosynthesis C-methylase UbiE